MIKPFALSVFLVLGAAAAHADVPNAAASTKPPGLLLVGHTGSTADPLGSETFVIRHLSGAPMYGAVVTIDFSGCGDVRLSADALEPGFILDCGHKLIRGTTDQNGRVTFRIVGAASGSGARALPACAAVYADGVPFPSLGASTFDLDGSGGVNALDLSIVFSDMHSGHYQARSDFDFDGDVDVIDLSRLYQVMARGGSTESGLADCP
jgi:hypothetical protein